MSEQELFWIINFVIYPICEIIFLTNSLNYDILITLLKICNKCGTVAQLVRATDS